MKNELNTILVIIIQSLILIFSNPVTRGTREVKIISKINNCECLTHNFNYFAEKPDLQILGHYSFSPCKNYDYTDQTFLVTNVESKDDSCTKLLYTIKTKGNYKGIKNYPNLDTKSKQYQVFEIVLHDSTNMYYYIKLSNDEKCLTFSDTQYEFVNLMTNCQKPITPTDSQLFKIIDATSIHIVNTAKVNYNYLQYRTNGIQLTLIKLYLYQAYPPYKRILVNISTSGGQFTVTNIEAGEYEVYQFGFDSPLEILYIDFCHNNVVNSVVPNTYITVNENNRIKYDYYKNFSYPCPKCKTYNSYTSVVTNNNFDFLMLNAYCPEGSAINSLVFDYFSQLLFINYRCFFSEKITNICYYEYTSEFDVEIIYDLYERQINCYADYVIKELEFLKTSFNRMKIRGRCCKIEGTYYNSYNCSRYPIRLDDLEYFRIKTLEKISTVDGGYNGALQLIRVKSEGHNDSFFFCFNILIFDDIYDEMLPSYYQANSVPWNGIGPAYVIKGLNLVCSDKDFVSSGRIRFHPPDYNFLRYDYNCLKSCKGSNCVINYSCDSVTNVGYQNFPDNAVDFLVSLKINSTSNKVLKEVLLTSDTVPQFDIKYSFCTVDEIADVCFLMKMYYPGVNDILIVDDFHNGGNGPNQALSSYSLISNMYAGWFEQYTCSKVIR